MLSAYWPSSPLKKYVFIRHSIFQDQQVWSSKTNQASPSASQYLSQIVAEKFPFSSSHIVHRFVDYTHSWGPPLAYNILTGLLHPLKPSWKRHGIGKWIKVPSKTPGCSSSSGHLVSRLSSRYFSCILSSTTLGVVKKSMQCFSKVIQDANWHWLTQIYRSVYTSGM